MSVAQVWLREGYGKITVNKRSFVEFFPRVEDRLASNFISILGFIKICSFFLLTCSNSAYSQATSSLPFPCN